MGQEEDLLNVSYSSSLPAKSEVTPENILDQAQRSLDRSIDLFNTIGTVMGIFVGLISLLIMLGGVFGYIEITRFKELNKDAKELNKEAKIGVEQIENKVKDAGEILDSTLKELNKKAEIYVEQIEDKVKDAGEILGKSEEVVSVAKPVFNRLEQIDKNAKISLEPFRERAKDLPYILEPFSEDQKAILEEYGKKIELLEAFGVPLKPEDYFNSGNDFYQEKKYDLALKAYDEAIELNPDYALAWINRGVALDELGRYKEALTAYKKAIELNPDYAEAWIGRGVALGNLGRYEEALTAYDKAIELKPDYARAWYNKACAYSLKGDKENTLKSLSKATDLDAKYKEMAKKDADFKNLWADEDFKRVVS
ncbi:Tetratricopeptide (TPR) repeat containing protein [Candidatus Methanophagaceae archaeon]|nr:Tetratricopeptide (TPR) repeat containing protein [Methanophagales archaeon]